MTVHSFLDDYSEGAHPEILAALTETNAVQQTAYGNDDYTLEARRLIAAECGQPGVPVFLVVGGTLANITICSAVLRSHEAVIAAATGHMVVRETGAIEATGHKIITMPSSDGKLSGIDIDQAMKNNAHFPHMARPRMVYVSNATELGTVYTLDELTDLRARCDAHDLLLLVDGARLGVALASTHAGEMTMADIARLADVFWIGGTKTGALFGEAIVIPNPELADDFEFHLKQRGALLAKGRTLGLQFVALFSDGLFGRAARHANETAVALAAGIRAAGFDLTAETQSNQVFAALPNPVIDALQERFAFYLWEPLDDDRTVIRLVTSWMTDPAQIDDFEACLTTSA